MNDSEMVAHCKKGDRDALDALILRFKRPIYSLAYRLTGNTDDAADVAGTAILHVCQNIYKCRTDVTIPAWVNRIVVNAYFDMYRRRKKRPSTSLESLCENSNDSILPFLESKEKTPLSIVIEHEQRDIMRAVLDRMPELHAEILCQYYVEERSYEEIAEISCVPLGTVKSRLNRARASLLFRLQAHRTVFVN